jgi:hypothetical protein
LTSSILDILKLVIQSIRASRINIQNGHSHNSAPAASVPKL